MNKLFNKKQNDKERMKFVKHWAKFVRTHPDKEWSRQQKVLINSMIKNARHFKLTPKQYLRIKRASSNTE